MAFYHLSADGVVRECSTTPEKCPLRTETGEPAPHFNDEIFGRKYAEKLLSEEYGVTGVRVSSKGHSAGFKNSSIKRRRRKDWEEQLRLEEEYYKDLLKESSLEDLDSPETKALKKLNAQDLAKVIKNVAKEEGFEEDMHQAVRMSTILHANQRRYNRGEFKTTPYIEHPLRNSVRISRWGVKDKDVLLAAVLHDTIEDGSVDYVKLYENENIEDGLEARGRLSKQIEKRFGSEVLRLVKSVSNDYQSSVDKVNQPLSEKTKIYTEHVDESLTDSGVFFLTKLIFLKVRWIRRILKK